MSLKHKTIKLLENDKEENLWNLETGKEFLDLTTEVMLTKKPCTWQLKAAALITAQIRNNPETFQWVTG